MDTDILRQRVPHTTCARCRKLFKAGDRAIPVHIIWHPNIRNPESQELSIQFAGEMEFIHASCVDPSLDGRLVVTA